MSTIVLKGSTAGTVTLQPAANISPNVTFTLPSVDGSAGQVLATNGSGTLSFITNDGTASFEAANSASAYANAAFAAANSAAASSVDSTAREIANSAGSYANGAFAAANTVNVSVQSVYDTANTLFDGSADLILDTITANTVTSVNVISSNEITANNITIANNFIVSGVSIQWHTPPLTSKGTVGDKAGWIAVDNDKIYRCVADYTDGTADIWVYVNFTGGAWG
jgi:hypothetical protein